MIHKKLPRKQGLDLVVQTIVQSTNPTSDLFNHLPLFPKDLIYFRGSFAGENAPEFVEEVATVEKALAATGSPHLRVASTYLKQGVEYLGEDDCALREAFWLGDQPYFFLDVANNAYNPSFAVSLFPEETSSISEKEAMMEEFTSPRFPKEYQHVKTLLLRHKDTFYLAVIPGDERLNTKALKKSLGLSNSANLCFATDDPVNITGRERGAVSPLIQQGSFGNLSQVFIADDLQEGYTQPHYSFAIDRRSALVVSDMNDTIDILKNTPGYPPIGIYRNRK